MDFRVEITGPAIADLAEIVSYIAQDNPAAAKALGENLLDAALSLPRRRLKAVPIQGWPASAS
jgi:plasmid stabilization system protein ParE